MSQDEAKSIARLVKEAGYGWAMAQVSPRRWQVHVLEGGVLVRVFDQFDPTATVRWLQINPSRKEAAL